MVATVSHPPVSAVGAPLGEELGRFGTDGIRGHVGTSVTPALALQVGYWTGVVLQAEGPVVIGTDSRRSGPMLVAALSAGLMAAGRELWQLGLCPTPAVPGTIRRQGAAGGLMVSASHNPPHDNGLKVFGATRARRRWSGIAYSTLPSVASRCASCSELMPSANSTWVRSATPPPARIAATDSSTFAASRSNTAIASS